jgi:hypothetical protein
VGCLKSKIESGPTPDILTNNPKQTRKSNIIINIIGPQSYSYNSQVEKSSNFNEQIDKSNENLRDKIETLNVNMDLPFTSNKTSNNNNNNNKMVQPPPVILIDDDPLNNDESKNNNTILVKPAPKILIKENNSDPKLTTESSKGVTRNFLSKGYSLMDWIRFTSSPSNSLPIDKLKQQQVHPSRVVITQKELEQHNQVI